ncbi:hypothetical protein B0T22DRAFT_496122 [Podospora appendiculata]|uniref:FluG domain-containing protein n=1 Tax=Podospora appendiculata TaxID=314037 RepID=A0AAE0XHC9_9PEZI|nr:hypothetical protein B0T22DRAFT_496122 [Podospora appendiculata]
MHDLHTVPVAVRTGQFAADGAAAQLPATVCMMLITRVSVTVWTLVMVLTILVVDIAVVVVGTVTVLVAGDVLAHSLPLQMVDGVLYNFAVLAAEFGRAGPPFSGVLTVRALGHSQRRAAAQPDTKCRPSHFSLFLTCGLPPPAALDTQPAIVTMPARCPPQPLAGRSADFVQQFTAKQRAAGEWIAKQPKALTADQREALLKQLEATQFLQPDYADGIKINIAGLLRKWKRAMVFLDYICETYRIKSWGTSWQYFRLYKQLYATVTGRFMNTNDSKEVKKYNIQPPCSHGKYVTNADTLLVLLTFNIRYDTSIFPWEGHRVQLPGCYLGLAFTGARPAEFVDREKRNAIRSIPDDENKAPNEHSRLLEDMISQEYEVRGRPEALCYEDILLMVPTIFFFTPIRRLIFCFISVIVSLAVYDRVFAVSKFTSIREVFQARNRAPVKCTPLRWKEEWRKRPVFRQYNESIAEEESDERKYQPLPYRKLHYDMERQSLDAGEENKIEPKAWRRGAANAADGGRYRIKGSEHEGKIRELTKLIATKEQQRKTAIRRDYQKHYFHNRPTWDMEADGQEEEEYVEPAIDLQIPERAQLAEILCNQPDNLSSAELLELRIQATELMVILCGKQETVRPDRIRRRVQAQADVAVKEESPGPDPFPLLMDRKQCPRCIGDKTLSQEERTFKYCRPAVMYDHFDRKHAQQLHSVKQMSCNHPKCKKEALEFKHLNHFKNHVESVHGVKLRA